MSPLRKFYTVCNKWSRAFEIQPNYGSTMSVPVFTCERTSSTAGPSNSTVGTATEGTGKPGKKLSLNTRKRGRPKTGKHSIKTDTVKQDGSEALNEQVSKQSSIATSDLKTKNIETVDANRSANSPDESISCMCTAQPSYPQLDEIQLVMYANNKAEARKKRVLQKKIVITDEQDESDLSKVKTSFANQLSSFLRLCIDQGKMEKARSSLSTYILNNNNSSRYFLNRRVLSADIPNILLRKYADTRDFSEALSLYEMMKEFGIAPNLSTYGWLFINALRQLEPRRFLKIVMDQINFSSHYLNIEDIIVKSDFRNFKEVAAELTQGLKVFYPDVHLDQPLPETDLNYKNQLVKHLSLFEPVKNPYAGVIDSEKASNNLSKHLHFEYNDRVIIQSVEQSEATNETLEARAIYEELRNEWVGDLAKGLEVKWESLGERFEIADVSLHPYVKAVSTESLVNMMLNEAEKLCEMSEFYSPSIKVLSAKLGHRVPVCYMFQEADRLGQKTEIVNILMKYIESFNDGTLMSNYRMLFKSANASLIKEQLMSDADWSSAVTQVFGQILYEIMFRNLKLPKKLTQGQSVPAFYTVYRMVSNKTSVQVKATSLLNAMQQRGDKQLQKIAEIEPIGIQPEPHPLLVNLVKKAKLGRIILDVTEVPICIPPLPWISQNQGSYIFTHVDMIRIDKDHLFGKCSDEQLLPIFDALNVIGSCPWQINKPVFEAVSKVYHEGGSFTLNVPEEEKVLEKRLLRLNDFATVTPENTDLMKKLKAEEYSERSAFLLGLSVANHFKDEVFWLPNNTDFRGRAYPFSAHFSHISDDPRRAMLKFAVGKPLGKRGLEWLKIHLVNLSGAKKRESNSVRLAYADEILPLAFQSAKTPFEIIGSQPVCLDPSWDQMAFLMRSLKGHQWWRDADDQWQALAACIELSNAYEHPDPTEYLSRLPVHQDGSCNGLQHYAAMGRDCLGATSVNVAPSDKPHDVYTDVVTLIEEQRKKDSENGNKLAQSLEGHLNRKIVKQSVMTQVYGVTEYGVKKQLLKHLTDQLPDTPLEWRKSAAFYLADKLSESMATLFKASTQIQHWLTLCAYLISSSTGKPVSWNTPLGLPVTQHYYSSKKTENKIKSSKENARESDNLSAMKPLTTKQKNGFPPNFIHSLDSTHMMLTALNCQRAGIAFISIHDCFWTHACDVDTMNKICRQSFIELYQQPILEDLRDYFLKNYVDPKIVDHKFLETVIRSIPSFGEFNIHSVMQSEYFFS